MALSLKQRLWLIKQALLPRSTQDVLSASIPMGMADLWRKMGKPPDVSRDKLVRKYWGWVYMCASISAAKLSSVPLKLYATRAVGEGEVKRFPTRKVQHDTLRHIHKKFDARNARVKGAEEMVELQEHPLMELLDNVNEHENAFELKELTSIMLDLTGDAYWYLENNKLGVPERLYVLRSQWTKIIPDSKTFIKGYLYGVSPWVTDIAQNPAGWGMPGAQGKIFLEPNEVIHFKYPNPNDPWYGMGPTEAAAYSIQNQEAREQYINAVMQNMARPDLLIRYKGGELGADERRRAEEEWNQDRRGPKKAGQVKVTDENWELEKIGWNPNELRFNEGEKWILTKICGAFPVPIGLVDTSEISRAPRAGMEGSDLVLAQLNTLPRCRRIEEKLNEQLCPRYDERLFLSFDNPVPSDLQYQLREDGQRLKDFVITVNEVRLREGLDPVPWGETPIAPIGVAPLGSAPAVQPAAGVPDHKPNMQARSATEDSGLPGGVSIDGEQVHADLKGVRLKHA